MRRREFLVGGAAAVWPVGVRAQQREQMKRVGILMNLAADDPEGQARNAAFLQGLQQFGWSVGRNLQIDYRWGGGHAERYRQCAAELTNLKPDVILAVTAGVVRALQETTRTVPIVFVGVIDPVGGSLVASLAKPEGNTTGFTNFEYSISSRWLELLKQIAPHVLRVAIIRDAAVVGGIGQLAAIQAVAPALGVELTPIGERDAGEMERTIAKFANGSNGGLIVTASTVALAHRELILKLAAQSRLPAVYPYRPFVVDGGLICYGPNQVDQYRRAAEYVDRILKGEKPSDLPVQAPTKYETVINLKTAKALGLNVPPTVLARADEVIE